MVNLTEAAQGHSNFGLSYLAEIFERGSPHHVEAQNKNAGETLANLLFLLFFAFSRLYSDGFVFFGLRENLADCRL